MTTVTAPVPPVGSATRPRIHSVDGLRGLFALGVLFHHYAMWFELELHPYLDGFLTKLGIYAVSGFFVISGLSLYHVYRGPMTVPAAREFFVRRFLRIAPLYYAVCVIDMAGHWYLGNAYLGYDSWAQFLNVALQNFLLVFGFYRPGETEMVVGGWSIGIEYTFYVVFPLLLLVLAGRVPRMLGLSAIALVVALAWPYLVLDREVKLGLQWGNYVSPFGYFVYFAVGILLGQLIHEYRLPRLWTLSGVAVSFLVFLLVAPTPWNNVVIVYGLTGALLLLATCALVGFCAFFQSETKLFRAVCKFLGEISYSLYLLHFCVFFAVSTFLSTGSRVLDLWLAVALALPLSFLVYHLYEKPFLRLGHRARKEGRR